MPKIDGKQTDVPKTEDVPRTQAFPLRPTPPRATVVQADAAPPKPQPGEEPKSNAKEEAKPKPALTPGDLAMALRQEPVFKDQGQADRPKKRRLMSDVPAEERLAALTSGEKMKQDGGVSTHDLRPSVDALATPFGDYDAALIWAVKRRWDDLLYERRFAGARTGKVVLRFHLNVDGTVTQMQLIDNTVDLTLALLCERAIRDPAPFARWPEELRREVGVNYREITFNFYYR